MTSRTTLSLTTQQARRIWLHAQGLDTPTPFGDGPDATTSAIEHLGYVQIDTINVIERCHHHILWTRIPEYRRMHLTQAQTVDKKVFEYWTHALSYVPTSDFHYFIPEMKKRRQSTSAWYSSVTKSDVQRVLTRIREEGPLSIRDIDDDVRVEKTHPWGSRKPSKRVLEFAFYTGRLAISQRSGMLKTYELIERHFGWTQSPKMASETRTVEYLLERALRSQGLVSLDSICHLDPKRKPAVHAAIERRVKRGELVPVVIDGAEKLMHWIEPRVIATIPDSTAETVHILSPFDPLIIQRKRLNLVFGYEHRFEAYLPKEKRLYGYFGLPILVDEEIVAVIDLKADRSARKLAVQKWTWTGTGDRSGNRTRIEEKLHQFERFQFEA